MARGGHWGRHEHSRKGPRLDHQRGEASGLRGRAAPASRRSQMVLHAEGKRRAPALPRRQCRRVRARYLQGPDIMRHDPHTLIEGCVIASFAMGAHAAYIYVAGSSSASAKRCRRRSTNATNNGLLAGTTSSGYDIDIYVHHGAGAYICGEETACSKASKARRARPRLNRLSRRIWAFYGCPTTVTCRVDRVTPTILRSGAGCIPSFGRPTTTAPSSIRFPATSMRP